MFIKRQLDVLSRICRISSSRQVMSASGITKVIAFFAVFAQLFGALFFDTPTYADGRDLMLDERFELVWSDEFDGGALDKNIWSGHYIWDAKGYQRDTSWWDMDHVRVEDGKLIITADKREGGPSSTGYYASGIDTHPGSGQYYGGEGYEQAYGYFEVSCILPKGAGLNPAFWLLGEGMFTDVTTGKTGCEIDVFETRTNQNKEKKWVGSVYNTIHYGSYDQYHKSEMQGHFYADNPYEEFNTYGLEWSESEYIWYINGVESARTSFGGVCEVPLYLILSICVDDYVFGNKDLPSEFIVDYVRAYQYR